MTTSEFYNTVRYISSQKEIPHNKEVEDALKGIRPAILTVARKGSRECFIYISTHNLKVWKDVAAKLEEEGFEVNFYLSSTISPHMRISWGN